MRRLALVVVLAAAQLLASPASLPAQDDLQRQIQESQLRLEAIRAERARLEREAEEARTGARDAAEELRNVERRLSASRSVLAEIEFQAEATAQSIQRNNGDMLRAHERLAEGTAVLRRRLRDIYKLGGLHTVRVLLGADSFSDLLNRYRYLRLVAAHDRALVERIGDLERGLESQDRELREAMTELGRLRQSKLSEVVELKSVESERQRILAEYHGQEARATTRLAQLDADAARMVGLIEDLEERRREEERRRAAAGSRSGSATLSAGDAGSLAWPVEGSLLYRFGREQRADGTELRWNGIGIAAPTGTPVRAVAAGRVVLAGPFEGYGPTVVLSHGNGFYTLYLYLEEIGVVQGRGVEGGQVVGTVGGSGTPEGPHLEFQVRVPVDGGVPRAQDPLRWLLPRGGS